MPQNAQSSHSKTALIYMGRFAEIIVPSFIHGKEGVTGCKWETFTGCGVVCIDIQVICFCTCHCLCFLWGGGESLGPISLSRLWDLHAELPVALMSYLHKFPGNRWPHRPCLVPINYSSQNLDSDIK